MNPTQSQIGISLMGFVFSEPPFFFSTPPRLSTPLPQPQPGRDPSVPAHAPHPSHNTVGIEVDFPVLIRHYLCMKLLERITVEPGKCGGRPCIRGLRIRVTDILGMLAEGVPHEEILRDFPYLEPDDIKAALAYAARQADHAVLQPT